jgi:4-amino-4-deoxy-L-arabinose transferase-like glycosyltransferase
MAIRPWQGLLAPLLPSSRWARVALLLLVVFVLARSLIWASAQPGWFAPDEDYHWHYVEHLLIDKEIPDLDEPFATEELYNAVVAVNHGHYTGGARTEYRGEPHALVREMRRRGGMREATGEPPRPVLHPPLYHLGAVVADRAVTWEAALTRLTAMRYWSALLGALGVWAAWLLAAQILAREWQQLAAASLVATQPIVAFSASTVTNDVLALLALTLVLAWCARALRRPPRVVDGALLGALLGFAVLTKATLLVTLPLAALTVVLSWRTFRISLPRLTRFTGLAALVLAAATGWWLRIILPETHSLLGARVAITSGPEPGIPGTGLGFFDAVQRWLRDVYATYWFDYLAYEVTRRDFWYFLPLVVGGAGVLALVATVVAHRRRLLDRDCATLRHVVVLVVAVVALVLPPMWFDVRAAMAGQAFSVIQGRFMAPAYPAAAVLFVLGLSHVLRGVRRGVPLAVGGVVALSFVNYAHTWTEWSLERFYGPVDGDWLAAFRRASWDKPEWIGPGWFATLAIVGVLAFVAGFVIVAVKARGRQPPHPARAAPGRPLGSASREATAAR